MSPGGLYANVFVVYGVIVCIVLAASPARRPANAALVKLVFPALEKPTAACPCPVTMIDGIQYHTGLDAVAVGSNTVPVCVTVGVPLPTGTLISYQRTPSRSLVPVDWPLVFTARLCAVHSLPLRMCAANSRSSSASSLPLAPPVLPLCGTVSG